MTSGRACGGCFLPDVAGLRVAWRLPAFGAITLVLFIALLLGKVLLFASPRARQRWRQWLFRGWARLVRPLTGMRATAQGAIPARPFLLIANHLSYMDIALLALYVDSVFVAKLEIASWPLLGRIVRAADTIFIDRTRRSDVNRVNGEIAAALARGDGVVVFAEGTSSSGDEVLPLKPSLLEAAATRAVPVHYARLSYRTGAALPPAREVVCWWGDADFFAHLLELLRLPEFGALVHFGPEAVPGQDRKSLARELHARISALPALDATTSSAGEQT